MVEKVNARDEAMEACVVVCRTQKPKTRRGKILFVNAVNEVTRERAQSFLTDEHLQRVVAAYQDFKDEPGFARVVPMEEIRAKDWSLNILGNYGRSDVDTINYAINNATLFSGIAVPLQQAVVDRPHGDLGA